MTSQTDLANDLIQGVLATLTAPEKTIIVAEGLGKVDSLLNGIRILADNPGVMSEEGKTRLLAAISTFRTESDAIAELEVNTILGLVDKTAY